MSLLKELEALQCRVYLGLHTKENGICNNLFDIISSTEFAELEDIFTIWPKYSGCISFPITCDSTLFKSPGDEYAYYMFDHTDLWDSHTAYGRLRRELLQFCIDYLEKQEGYHVTA